MKRTDSGIYFRAETREMLRVTGSDPGEGWLRIAEDHNLGLLEARLLVRELRLDDDPSSVHWQGMGEGRADDDTASAKFILQLKREAKERAHGVQVKRGRLARLAARLKHGGRMSGQSSDSPSSGGNVRARASPREIQRRADPAEDH